jgi:hypothetical protein
MGSCTPPAAPAGAAELLGGADRGPSSGAVAVLAASARPMDRRGSSPPRPHGGTLSVDVAPLARLPGRTAAVAVGDLDGDGQPEVAVLLEGEVWILDADGQLRARQPLSALPAAANPAREPFGTLCIHEGRLAVASARSEGGLAFQLDRARLVSAGSLPGPTLGCGAGAPAASFLPGQARLREAAPAAREILWGAALHGGQRLALLPYGTARDPPSTVGDGSSPTWVPARRSSLGGRGAPSGEQRRATPRDVLRLLRWEGGPTLEVEVPGRILQVRGGGGRRGAPTAGRHLTSDGGSELRWVRDGR